MRRIDLALLLLLAAGCGGGGRVPEAAVPGTAGTAAAATVDLSRLDLLAGLDRRVLANGLVALVKEDRRLPVVTILTAYRIGSVNEDPGITGVSHFLEHMLFKGTDRFRRGEIDLLTYRAGGSNNAFTTPDMTGYWFRISSDRLEEFVALEANRMTNCTLDEQEFQNEKQVVLEELNQDLDDPWGEITQALEKTVFRHSRYHHPVLGWREDLEKMTREQMAAYYRSFYRPNNAVVMIFGDVRRADAFALVEKHFGPVGRGTDASPTIAAEPPQDAERRVDLRSGRGMDRLKIAWRTDRVGSPTDLALDVLSAILTEGKSARLNRRLVDAEKLAALGDVSSVNDARRHDGLFTIEVQLMPESDLARAEEVVQEELDRLKKEPVGERELERAKNLVSARFLFGMESSLDFVERVATYEALGLPEYPREYLGRIRSMTGAGLQETAKACFTRERRTVGYARGKEERRRRGPRRRTCGRRPVQATTLPDVGATWEHRTADGLTIVAQRREGVPVLHLEAFVRGGFEVEPEEKAGLANLVGEMLDEGIEDPASGRRRTDQEIAESVEFVGGVLTSHARGASIRVLAKDRSLAWDLVRDLLRHASFPAERLEALREEVLASIAGVEDEPVELARQLFYETVYAGHPLHRPSQGYETTVPGIGRDDLLAHYRKWFRPENTILVVVGEIDPREAIEDLLRRFEDWHGAGPFEPSAPAAPPKREGRSVHRFMELNQANVFLGHPGIRRDDPDYVAMRVAESILCRSAGFTDRLSKKIRDERGLAYSVGGTLTDEAAEEPGPFLIYLGTRTEQMEEAVSLAREELRRFVEEGPTEEEVRDARNHLSRNVVFDWETSEGLAAYHVETRRFHLGSDHARRYVHQLRAVTREEVHAAVKRHLDPAALTLAVVGRVDENGRPVPEK